MSIRFRCAMLAGIVWLSLSAFWSSPQQIYPLATASGSVLSRSQQPPLYERDFLIASAREIITSARYCALITTDAAGRVHARTMDAFAPEADMTVWLGTNSRSRKVKEIRRQPKVTLYYFNRENEEYVTLSGVARLVNDPKEKATRWKEEWKAFYPDRARDYLLIEVKPERLEVVSVKKTILGDSRNWDPPTVTFTGSKPKQ